MFRNILQMQKRFGYKNFDFVPETFILPEEAELLREDAKEEAGWYIVKPAGSCQGRGISLVSNIEDVCYSFSPLNRLRLSGTKTLRLW